MRKCFQFGICNDSPMLTEARLVYKIGDDARKWRFETKVLPMSINNESNKEKQNINLGAK